MDKLIEFILSLFSTKEAKTSPVVTKKQPGVNLDDINKTKKYQKENRTSRRDFHESIKYKNDSKRLEKEHNSMQRHNKDMVTLLAETNKFTNRKYKKPILITMLFRTQSEQDYLYRNSARYKKKKFISPHQLWHGADIRSHSFTSKEIKEIEAWINKKYNTKNHYKWTAKFHNNGNGNHLHIQFAEKDS